MGAPDFHRFLSPPTGDVQAPVTPVPTAADESDLARKLDVVVGHALDKIDELLVLASDVSNGNLVRGQVAAATAALNTAAKVDELRLRQRANPDILPKIIQMMKEEKERLLALGETLE
jgi:hypothetical protein